MATAKTGDTVTINYVVRTQDGRVVGGTEENGPQTLKLGNNEIFPQIEEALTTIAVGDETSVTIESDKAFGPRRDDLVIDIPRNNLPAEPAPQPGMALSAQQDNGQTISLVITKVEDATITADGNHPLAGEDLTFDLNLVEIKDAA